MKQSDLSYLHTVAGVDATLSEMMYGSGVLKGTVPSPEMFGVEEVSLSEKDAKAVLGTIADVTPFVGSAKAATELPEDAALVQDLMTAGYNEGDIKKMGLGGGLALLIGLGFLPGVKLAADVGKRAIKEGVEEAAGELGTQTRRAFGQDALISPQRQEQLDAAAELPASERRRFLKEANRPDQLVFHGASSMSKSPEINKIDRKISTGLSINISAKLQDVTRKNDEQGKPFFDNNMKSDEFVTRAKFIGLGIPVFDEVGEYTTMPVRLRKTNDGEIEIVQYNEETLMDEFVLDTIDKSFVSNLDQMDRTAGNLRIALTERLNDLSKEFSAVPSGKSRKDKIRQGGFDPFDTFEGAVGMGGMTRGSHAELSAKALSTSVDPGVSMKPAFAGTDPENIVYSRLPRDRVRDMTPEEYVKQTAFRERKLADELPLKEGEVGYRLPKSIHLEDEIAVTRPEELDVKSLTDDPYLVTRPVTLDAPSDEFVGPMKQVGAEKSLLDLVKGQQKEVESLLFSMSNIATVRHGVPLDHIKQNKKYRPAGSNKVTESAQRKAYDMVRSILSRSEGLGKYARGQGTGDTYDNLMDDIMLNKYGDDESDFYRVIEALAEHLPEGSQRKTHMQGLLKVATALKDKPVQGAESMARQDLRNLPDNYLRDVIYKGKAKDDDEIDDLLRDAGYRDLKRLMMIGTQNMNRGGLMTPR